MITADTVLLCPGMDGDVALCRRGFAATADIIQRGHQPPTISSAARSPIIIAAAFVLPPTMLGMIEASATRSPSTPRTRSVGIDDRAFVGTHPTRPDRVIHARSISTHEFREVGAVLIRTREAPHDRPPVRPPGAPTSP